MTEETEDAETQEPSIYKDFGQKVRLVRPQGCTSRSAVQQALIVGAFQDASIQYIASYYSDYPPYVVVRSSARHCVLYDMKRICSAYEAKFSQPEKLT